MSVCSLQEGLDARIQKKEQARLQQLREAAEAHKAQELERKYAVRYHKVHRPKAAAPLNKQGSHALYRTLVALLVNLRTTLMQIRFFERVKLERRIKQLERETKADDPSMDGDLHAKLAQAREDLQVSSDLPMSLLLWPTLAGTTPLGAEPMRHSALHLLGLS